MELASELWIARAAPALLFDSLAAQLSALYRNTLQLQLEMTRSASSAVPNAMQVQLSRLFGSGSAEAKLTRRTSAQWKRTLKLLLIELESYLEENIDTDGLHRLFLESGLYAARESLDEEEFWPGYVEGLIRLCLVLMGDYPDHRRRKGGRKQEGHYKLQRSRSIQYAQTPGQKLFTLFAAGNVRLPGLSKNPRDAMTEFREEVGYDASYRQFLRWYRTRYSKDYVLLF